MDRPKVLLTAKIDKAGIDILEKVADVKFASSTSEETLAKEAVDVDGMIVRVPAVITRKILENAKKLKVIARFGVGYDDIDVQAATEKGVVVTYTPGANALSVAEYAVALMFALGKQLMQVDKALRQHDWDMRLSYSGIELSEKTLGLVGLGRVGTQIAHIAKGINMKILISDPYVTKEKANEVGAELVQLDPLLRQSDFIVVCCLLTDETRGLISAKAFDSMKPTAYLINVARGPIVDEKALIKALADKRIAGAGLDVFEEEPPFKSPLLKLDNVIVGPHVAALAKDANIRVSVWVAEDTVRVLKHEKPLYPVNSQVLDKARS